MIKNGEKIISDDLIRENTKKIYDINSILNYQEGSVVSRTLINKNEGTITLFSFDKDESLSENDANNDKG